MHNNVFVWRSKDNLQESFPPFTCASRDPTQISSLKGTYPHLVSYLRTSLIISNIPSSLL